MESTNPFIQRIHAERGHVKDYEPITGEDAEKYRLRGQNFKFTQPGKFAFIDVPVEFIAMEVDEHQQVKSMLLYLHQHETMLESLTIAYGKPAITMNMEGQVAHVSGGSQQETYTSHTWTLDGHRLTLTVLPVKTKETDAALKAQLFIE
jgi:uncharacterized protein with ACT and thioredoxin-like domain